MQRPVWLLSMDSEQFNAPPTTTAGLASFYRRYGARATSTRIDLVHFQHSDDIACWLAAWQVSGPALVAEAIASGLEPVLGFSVYTWNAAEFLALARQLRALAPELTLVAGGPHVQQAEDYLGAEALDVIFMGEAEVTFQEFLDSNGKSAWHEIDGLAFLDGGRVVRTRARARCQELDRFPSPLDVLELTHPDGSPRYDAIAYETSRGCPFKCAFCEWGTGAIGSKMYQWSLPRIRDDWEKITAAGIANIWLADSNFGALKQDLAKAQMIVELKQRSGLPRSFATSWSKKHSRQVQEIALLLHRNQLLPHYQLALQTLTPEALRLSNRQNMSANEYQPIARQMSEQGVPIAAELIWGLPGDNLADFERNLDTLLATFPNINIFGYTLLPGTEFYARRDEYRIEAIPVAGYGKAKGEYVVGCHSFSRDEGEEGYFLISAHILLVHGHIMPLTTRLLALQGEVPVSPLLRECLRAVVGSLRTTLVTLDASDRMSLYENRNAIYLAALADRERLYKILAALLEEHCRQNHSDPTAALQVLALDSALCPRSGGEQELVASFDFRADRVCAALSSMNLPAPGDFASTDCSLRIRHPGGVGDILKDADGGSWLRGVIDELVPAPSSSIQAVALA
ncbi:MAG: cobalamin-dependent protein [Haliea sp.]|uniref:B12-binding domain-containing radical SAM protein n=1 Tax=Haliea sp. TaxID=1932666 RepID=UPI0032EA8FFB